jgi:hypothetical protein
MTEPTIKHIHHHVPVFHIKKWYGQDNEFFVYRKYGNGTINCQKKNASQFFYERDLNLLETDGSLYAKRTLKPDLIEDRFDSEFDNLAAPVLEKMVSGKIDSLSAAEKKNWARYVRSLMFRTPAKVAQGERMIADSMKTQREFFLQNTEGAERKSENALFDKIFGRGFQNNFVRYKMIESSHDESWIEKLVDLKWVVAESESETFQFIMAPDPVWAFEHEEWTWFLAVPLCPEQLWIAYPSNRFPEEDHVVLLKHIIPLYNLEQMKKSPEYIVSKHELLDSPLYLWSKILNQSLKQVGGIPKENRMPTDNDMPEQPLKRKHHHVPVFHLKKWHGEDGKFFVYQKYGNGSVRQRKKCAEEFFYEPNLYMLEEDTSPLSTNHLRADFAEDELAKQIDDKAAPLLDKMLLNGNADLTDEERRKWARYVYSLIDRTPDSIAESLSIGERSFTRAAKDLRQRMPNDERSKEAEKRILELAHQSKVHVNFPKMLLVDEKASEPWIAKMLVLHRGMVRIDSTASSHVMSPNPVVQIHALFGLPLSPSILWIAFPKAWLQKKRASKMLIEFALSYNLKLFRQPQDYCVSFSELQGSSIYNWTKVLNQGLKRQGPKRQT